jgi:TetR/AcrR family acrAB operon transcriptional repressor
MSVRSFVADHKVMARPKDEALQDRILHAATRAFSDRGFAAASMTEIGRLAGVTKGGVYFHFRTKEQLFFAVLDYWREALREVLGQTERGQTLRGFLEDYLAFHFRYPEATSLLRVLATELRGRFTAQVREDLRSAQAALRSRIRQLLVVGVQDGSLFTSDPAMASFLIASTLEGVLSQWISSRPDAEPFCDPTSLADLVLAPLETGTSPRAARGAGELLPEKEAGADFLPPF